jgi:CRP-like cAMP-binding protein|tara:strand:+ start:441 stop:1028 length:588 start_codon:yes stop_codon:yes gene_type:complete
MLNFSNYISQFVLFPGKDKKILNKLCTTKNISKNKILIGQGDIAKEAYFLQKGMMVMVYEKKGRQYIRDFVFDNTPTVAFPSFFNNKPARYSIKTLTKCTLEVLSKRNYIEACIKIPRMKSIALTGTNHGHMALEKRFEAVLTLTPEERYIDLLQNNREMVKKIPVGLIASYLGISIQSLSRIRRRLTDKKNSVI